MIDFIHQYLLPLLPVLPWLGFFWSGCPCCDGCDVCADGFSGSDGTDLNTDSPCGWTERVRNWTRSSNAAVVSGSGALMTCNTAAGAPDYTITVRAKSGSSGDRVRVIVDYVDNSNYWIVEFAFGSGGRMKVIRRKAGGEVDTVLSGTMNLSLNTYYTLKVCTYSENGVIRAQVGSSSAIHVVTGAWGMPLTGSQIAGLGTGSAATNATFDDWVLGVRGSGGIVDVDVCPCSIPVPCSTCYQGVLPSFIDVELPNLLDNYQEMGGEHGNEWIYQCGLGNCEIAGTYRLPLVQVAGSGTPGSGYCEAIYQSIVLECPDAIAGSADPINRKSVTLQATLFSSLPFGGPYTRAVRLTLWGIGSSTYQNWGLVFLPAVGSETKCLPQSPAFADIESVDIANDSFTATGHPFETGDIIVILGQTGAHTAPYGFNMSVTKLDANNFKVDRNITSGGLPIRAYRNYAMYYPVVGSADFYGSVAQDAFATGHGCKIPSTSADSGRAGVTTVY